MRQHGKNPVGLWRVVNGLANTRNPDSRARRRCWRLRYLCAFRELLRAGALVRHGPLIALQDFATRPRPRLPRRLPPSVGGSARKLTGSNPVVVPAATAQNDPQATELKLVSGDANRVGSAPEGKSAPPTLAEITEAARRLAQRPRRRKKWSGWLNGERMWRLREVIVPGGQVLPAYFVRRNWVYALLPDTPEYRGSGLSPLQGRRRTGLSLAARGAAWPPAAEGGPTARTTVTPSGSIPERQPSSRPFRSTGAPRALAASTCCLTSVSRSGLARNSRGISRTRSSLLSMHSLPASRMKMKLS